MRPFYNYYNKYNKNYNWLADCTPRGEFKVLIAEWAPHWAEVRRKAEFDKEQMRSYGEKLVILGDAELNAFFHLLGINSKIVD